MRITGCWAAISLCAFLGACAVRPLSGPLGAEALSARLSPVLGESESKGVRWGIVVSKLDGSVLFSRNATQRFIPASNTKLFTTAAAMMELADLKRIEGEHLTTLFLKPRGGGAPDLVLRGSGDPFLSDEGACQKDCLQALADAVSARHIRRVHAVIGDDRLFPHERWGAGWSWNNLQAEWGTAVSALTLNDNVAMLDVLPGRDAGVRPEVHWASSADALSVTNLARTTRDGEADLDVSKDFGQGRVVLSGKVPLDAGMKRIRVGLDDPAMTAARHFRDALSRRGISVQGVRVSHRLVGHETQDLPQEMPVLAALPASDLGLDVRYLLKVSQNLHAELLLRRLGLVHGDGSVAEGVAERTRVLKELGVDPAGFAFYDGSGMSSYNRVTPQTVVRLLRLAAMQPWGTEWRDDLPLAGRDGTLAHRFDGTVVEGRFHAKTGTLEATYALSGYLQTVSGQTLLMSVFMNDVPDDLPHPTRVMDAFVEAVAGLE